VTVPTLGAIVLDCPDPMALGAFYARLLDWDAPTPEDGWATITGPDGGRVDFQEVADYAAPTWPSGERPQQVHLDLSVADLDGAHERAVGLGARLVDDSHETFRVYLDPVGHPFCLCAC
jgi:hypothetical protein